jgi:hypothetical protein
MSQTRVGADAYVFVRLSTLKYALHPQHTQTPSQKLVTFGRHIYMQTDVFPTYTHTHDARTHMFNDGEPLDITELWIFSNDKNNLHSRTSGVAPTCACGVRVRACPSRPGQ